jgi:hypothetical protein
MRHPKRRFLSPAVKRRKGFLPIVDRHKLFGTLTLATPMFDMRDLLDMASQPTLVTMKTSSSVLVLHTGPHQQTSRRALGTVSGT